MTEIQDKFNNVKNSLGDFITAGDDLATNVASLHKTINQGGLSQSTVADTDTITSFAITWTFDKKYPVGQYANGDWWVVGPVTVVSITPESKLERPGDTRIANGSQINPTVGAVQGYDNEMKWTSYVAALNVAFDVSPITGKKLVVPVNSSLISTKSVVATKARPQLSDASVLTVVASAPQPGDFRPAYVGASKVSTFNASNIDYSLLKSLAPASTPPSWSKMERIVERVYLDHIPDFPSRNQHPSNNMSPYGRDLCYDLAQVAAMLHTDATIAQKTKTVIGLIQIGIDIYGVAANAGNTMWPANGGHASGRVWPPIFAGLMLNDPAMQNVRNIADFGETDQCFYVRETTPAVVESGKPAVFNNGYGKYTLEHKDMPEWGIRHRLRPQKDELRWHRNYRECCTAASWYGNAFAADVMGARALWKSDAFFDYMERYNFYAKFWSGKYVYWGDPLAYRMWEKYTDKYSVRIDKTPPMPR